MHLYRESRATVGVGVGVGVGVTLKLTASKQGRQNRKEGEKQKEEGNVAHERLETTHSNQKSPPSPRLRPFPNPVGCNGTWRMADGGSPS